MPHTPPDIDEQVVLTDGGRARIRPLLPGDEPAYRAFVSALSPRSQYYRFFTPRHDLSDTEIHHFLLVDHRDREALIAVRPRAGAPDTDEIVAVARYDRLPDAPDAAEVAFVVRDDVQGRGLGPLLLRLLAAAALAKGIRRFEATVLPDNLPMLKVFARSGWVVDRSLDGGAIAITLNIDRPEIRRIAP